MTIKELCQFKPEGSRKICDKCVFSYLCPYYSSLWEIPMNKIIDEDNNILTKAIIETAKALQADSNHD